jgi:hypothetical protein
MARKKVVKEEEVEEIEEVGEIEEAFYRVENKIPIPISEVQEELIRVRANGSFSDGAFKADFAKYGYKTVWSNNEVRLIPVSLYLKLMKRSGGKFAIAGDE